MSLSHVRKDLLKKKKTQKAVVQIKRLINSAILKLRASFHRYHKQSEQTKRRYLLIYNLKYKNQLYRELYI